MYICVYIYIYIYVSLSLSLSLYIYIYMYIYIYRERERDRYSYRYRYRPRATGWPLSPSGLPLCCSSDWPAGEGGRHQNPDLSKVITFAATPLVLTPFVRNQLSQAGFGETMAGVRRGTWALKSAMLVHHSVVTLASPSILANKTHAHFVCICKGLGVCKQCSQLSFASICIIVQERGAGAPQRRRLWDGVTCLGFICNYRVEALVLIPLY